MSKLDVKLYLPEFMYGVRAMDFHCRRPRVPDPLEQLCVLCTDVNGQREREPRTGVTEEVLVGVESRIRCMTLAIKRALSLIPRAPSGSDRYQFPEQ